MPAVTGDLAGTRSESLDQLVGETTSDVEKRRLAGRFIMNNRGLNQVTCAIEFVEISEVFETMPWPPRQEMTIYVSIGSLGAFKARDDIVHRLLQAIVFVLLEIARCSLQPLSEIRIPKDTGSPIPAVT